MLIQTMPAPKFDAAALSLAMPDEVASSASLERGRVTEKRRKKEKIAITKKGSILSHIIDRMVWKENVERFDESFTAYLKLGHYLFAPSRIANLHQAEAALTLSEDKRKKVEEEVGAKRERVVKAFKSSQAMEDIKIAFAKEAFLQGFMICMRRVMKNFSEVDLDLLMDEPSEEVDLFDTGVASPSIEPTLEASKLEVVASESALEPEVVKDMLTSSAAVPPEV
ncbi:hypothetical protein COCNU_contig69304799G000010 [Cocos nucifera]|nr:hypothetical protein [Cocos nucifera]